MGERKLLCLSSDVAKSLQPNPVWKKVVGFSGNHEEECGAAVEGGRGGEGFGFVASLQRRTSLFGTVCAASGDKVELELF